MMNHITIILNSLCSSPLLVHSYIILFSLITTTTFSLIDPHYEICKPQTCGNSLNISYPFYIQGRQEPFCGYPGFGITCNRDGYPLLNLSNTPYIIDQIFYENASLRVSNAVLSRWVTDGTGCLSLTQNLTLPPSNRFRLGQSKKDIMLLFDCDLSLLPRGMQQHSIGCSAGNEKNSVLALDKEDKDLNLVNNSCRGDVVDAVVMDDGNKGSGGNIGEALRRGFLLNWTASDCNLCRSSGGRCGFNFTIYNLRCYCTDRPHASYCQDTRNRVAMKIRLPLVLASSVVVSLLLLLGCCFRRRLFALTICRFCNKALPTDETIIEQFLEQHGSLPTRRYNYSEIKKFTNDFKVKLGQGGYGSVYKGNLQDGSLVAVKVLGEPNGTGEEFINEVASISRTSHVNIVTLVGFCFQGSKRALIYEFMPNGSLEKFIYEENSATAGRQLDCKTLYDIVIGVARGLDYLHRGCNTKILHFDIKPHNILLDEDFCPKISDFGLAKICPRKESIVSMVCARGTIGYIAPEVFSRCFGGVSHKADVYSYGMMVLEMVGGKHNKNVQVDCSSDLYFPHWVYKRLELDQDFGLLCIKNESDKETARKMIVVSLWCIQTNPSSRPSMNEVVEMLQGSLGCLTLPPKPFLNSVPTSPTHYSSQTHETL